MYARPEPRKCFREHVSEQIIGSLSACVVKDSEEKRGNNVLVVDDFALAILNAAVSQNDLLRIGFMSVCPFETKKQLAEGLMRRRYQYLDVVYYMRPKRSNLQRICEDYRQDMHDETPDLLDRCFPCIFRGLGEVEPDPPMYADCRVLIIPGLKHHSGASNSALAYEWLGNQIEARGKELERLGAAWKRTGPRECIVEFMAYEPSLFSLDMPDTLSRVYTHTLAGAEERELEEARERVFDHLDSVAYRTATACISMNEMPYIRYSSSARGISEVVARALAKSLTGYMKENPSFKPWGDPRSRADDDPVGPGARVLRPDEPPEPATVIILDRVDDLAPAVLHDITYTCLVTDLLEHDPCTPFHYTYTTRGNTVAKDVLLDDTDPVWRMLRYEEMGVVIETVDDGVRQGNMRADARQAMNPQDVNDLREMMAAITGDEKFVDEKFKQHYRMKAQIVDFFDKRHLTNVCTLQQELVTGCDAAGVKVNNKEVEKSMRKFMQDDALTSEDQARLMILFILCHRSVDIALRNELFALSHITRKQQTAIMNLTHLSVPTQRKATDGKSESAPFHDEDTLKRNRKATDNSSRLCRYVTKLEDVIHNFIAGTLPEEQYPWLRKPAYANRRDGGGRGGELDSEFAAANANMLASHAKHGEVTNRYTAEVLLNSASGGSVPTPLVGNTNRRNPKSKYASELMAGGTGAGGSSAAARQGTASSNSTAPAQADPFTRALEPIKPRLYSGGRIVVFVVGGITQLEVAALERMSRETGREIVYGGTSLLTFRDLLDQLYHVDPEVEDLGGGTGGASSASGRNISGGGGAFPAVDDF